MREAVSDKVDWPGLRSDRPVVVGFSGRSGSFGAMCTALDHIATLTFPFYVLHVCDLVRMVWLSAESPTSLAYLCRAAEAEAFGHRDRLVEHLGPEDASRWTFAVRRGTASRELAQFALDVDASAIVVSVSHARISIAKKSVFQEVSKVVGQRIPVIRTEDVGKTIMEGPRTA